MTHLGGPRAFRLPPSAKMARSRRVPSGPESLKPAEQNGGASAAGRVALAGYRPPPPARTLNRLPFLGPVFAAGWPLDNPGGPRNQLKKSQKAGRSAYMVPNMCRFGLYRVQEVHLRRSMFYLLNGLSSICAPVAQIWDGLSAWK
jgi:hypothetical protein